MLTRIHDQLPSSSCESVGFMVMDLVSLRSGNFELLIFIVIGT